MYDLDSVTRGLVWRGRGRKVNCRVKVMAILTCLSPSKRQIVETSLKSGGPIVFFSGES